MDLDKVCTACSTSKPLDEFYSYQRKNRKSRCLTSTCKKCFNEKAKVRRESNPEIKAKQAAREKEKRESDPEFRQRKIEAARKWYVENGDRHREYGREYRNRPDRIEIDRIRKASWNKSEAGRAYFAARQRQSRSTPEGKLATSLRKLISRTVDATGERRCGRTESILGYDKLKLKQRMECQFKPGMSWGNHGEWHIDHKKPVAEFIRNGISDPKIINSLCNLQPLWASENASKSDSWSVGERG